MSSLGLLFGCERKNIVTPAGGFAAGYIAGNQYQETAIVVEKGKGFYVVGSGAVYVIDGSEVTYSNIADAAMHKTLSIYNVKMHMLSQGDRFDLIRRAPRLMKGRAADKLPDKEEEETEKVA